MKVPAIEQPFLMDQRHERKMVIGHVDVAEIQQLRRRISRSISTSSRVNGIK